MCCFLHRQSIVSDVMLLIARALVLLIRGGLFDLRLCTFFLVLLGCYSLSLLFQIEGSDDYTLSFVLTCRLKRVMMMHVMLAHGILI